MRTFLVITGIMTMLLNMNAQSVMDKYYDKYSETEGFVAVYISKYMFDMLRNDEAIEKGSEDDVQNLINNLNCIKMLLSDDDPSTSAPVNLYQEMMKVLPSSDYKEIMVVKEQDQNIKFYVKENKNKKVEELLLIIGGGKEEGNALISIQGDIDMKNISKLARTMEIEGMENLEKIDE